METQAIMDLDWDPPSVPPRGEGSPAEYSEEEDRAPVGSLAIRGKGTEHLLFRGDNMVGRGHRNDIIINDPTVSDTHAVITIANDEAVVKDLKSR